MKFSQKTVKVCGYTFRNFHDAESYARRVYADTVGTFGLMDKRTQKAAREWTKVQNILATATD
jgi:hypothetical protein